MDLYSRKSLIAQKVRSASAVVDRLLLKDAPISTAPTDLSRLLLSVRIHTVNFRPMLSDGLIRPDAQGFTVFLNSAVPGEIDVKAGLLLNLTVRQRFTLAHEIAHTLFFDLGVSPPLERTSAEVESIVEPLCQRMASMLLIPEHVLRKRLGPYRTVDSLQLICDLAEEFQTSVEVLLRRLDILDGFKATDYMLMFCERDVAARDSFIKACTYSHSLINVVCKPELFSSFGRWCGRNLRADISTGNSGTVVVPHNEGHVCVEKKPYNLNGDFLVGVRFQT
jgi:hypothetical protein